MSNNMNITLLVLVMIMTCFVSSFSSLTDEQKIIMKLRSESNCLGPYEICGFGEKYCCEGLYCAGRYGCLPIIGPDGNRKLAPKPRSGRNCVGLFGSCALIGALCCEGLHCADIMKVCLPNLDAPKPQPGRNCLGLFEVCGFGEQYCCEGLYCAGREGCLPFLGDGKKLEA